jgi:cell division transport system permease protein
VRFGLIMGEVASGLRRNVSMVVSVILVTFISLTFVGAAILLQMQITQMKGYWYDRAQVAVYLCTDLDDTGNCTQAEATQAQIDNIEQRLQSETLAPYIEKYEFESHEQAYENFQTQLGDSPMAGFVTPETLNESFRVNLIDPSDADILIESLSGEAGVEDVQDQRGYLDQIFAVLNAASYTAIGVAALMLVAAVLLIATTIRLSAFSRRRELGIMRLVGASNRFIQTPFILEGVFAAVIGSLFAGGAIVAIVQFFVRGYLAPTLGPNTTLVSLGDALVVVPILLVVGAALAAASAGVAIARYLKV